MSVGDSTKYWQDFLDIPNLLSRREFGPRIEEVRDMWLCVSKSTGNFLYDTYHIGEPGDRDGYFFAVGWVRNTPGAEYYTGENCYFDGTIEDKKELTKVINQIFDSEYNEIFDITLYMED